jgi:hypothetical protein
MRCRVLQYIHDVSNNRFSESQFVVGLSMGRKIIPDPGHCRIFMTVIKCNIDNNVIGSATGWRESTCPA